MIFLTYNFRRKEREHLKRMHPTSLHYCTIETVNLEDLQYFIKSLEHNQGSLNHEIMLVDSHAVGEFLQINATS